MLIRSREDIRAGVLANLVARTGTTDIREGGVLVQVAEVITDEVLSMQNAVWESRNASLLGSATGADLDAKLADALPDGIQRTAATRATGGFVQFTRPSGPAMTVVPAGTPVIKSLGSVRYVTTADSTFTLLDAPTSSPVSVACQRLGSIGNAGALEIDTLGSTVDGVTGVKNTSSINNGTDGDSDERAREIARLYIRSVARAVESALIYNALQVDVAEYGRVRHAKVVYDPAGPGKAILLIDDGAGSSGPVVPVASETLVTSASGGETRFFLENRPLLSSPVPVVKRDGVPEAGVKFIRPWGQVILGTAAVALELFVIEGYSYYGGLCQEVQKVVNGQLNDIVNFPGIGGAGCEVIVKPASVYDSVPLRIDIGLILNSDDQATVRAAIARTVTEYVNSLGIGETLYRGRIIELIMSTHDEVVNVTYVRHGPSINVDSDVNPAESEVIRTTDESITST